MGDGDGDDGGDGEGDVELRFGRDVNLDLINPGNVVPSGWYEHSATTCLLPYAVPSNFGVSGLRWIFTVGYYVPPTLRGADQPGTVGPSGHANFPLLSASYPTRMFGCCRSRVRRQPGLLRWKAGRTDDLSNPDGIWLW